MASSQPLSPPSPSPVEYGVWIDQRDSGELFQTWKEAPLLRKENADLREGVNNLKDQLKIKDSLLEISEERRKVQVERSEFYQEIAKAEEKLADRYSQQNEKLQKQLDKKVFWEKVFLVVAVIAGVAIGLAF